MKSINKTLGAGTAAFLALGVALGPALTASAEEVIATEEVASSTVSPVTETIESAPISPESEALPVESPSAASEESATPSPESSAVVAPSTEQTAPSVEARTSTPKPEPTYTVVLWKKTTDKAFPQTLVAHAPTTDLNLSDGNVDLAALLPQYLCGDFQGDVYEDGAARDTLINGGVLNASENPNEPWPFGDVYKAEYSTTFSVTTNCTPPPPPVTTTECTAVQTIKVTPSNLQGFNFSPTAAPYADTRPAGHYEFVDGALRLYTDNNSSQAKVVGMRAVSIKAADYGTGADVNFVFTSGSIEPGVQVRVDIDGNGTSDGTLVSEDVYSETYWTNTAGLLPVSQGGQGGPFAGDMNDLLAVYPNATVVAEGFSLGSGVLADGKLVSLETGCTTYVFDVDPIVEPPVDPPVVKVPVAPQFPSVSDSCGTENDSFNLPGEAIFNEDGTYRENNDGTFRYLFNSVDTNAAGGEDRTVYAQLLDPTKNTIAPGAGYTVDPQAGNGNEYAFFDGILSTTDEACPVTDTPVTDTPATPAATSTQLPFTGFEGDRALILGTIALAMLVMGGLGINIARNRKVAAE